MWKMADAQLCDVGVEVSRALHTSIRGLPKDWRRRQDVRITPGFGPWKQTFSCSIMAWTQHGDTPRTEDVGSSSWKRLRSSQGHARDDDDDDDGDGGRIKTNYDWLMQASWRKVVAAAVSLGIPTPAFSSALAFYDGYRSSWLPANLLQVSVDVESCNTRYHGFAKLGQVSPLPVLI